MTGLRICDTKISIINHPFKSEEQNSIDIMVFIYNHLYFWAKMHFTTPLTNFNFFLKNSTLISKLFEILCENHYFGSYSLPNLFITELN